MSWFRKKKEQSESVVGIEVKEDNDKNGIYPPLLYASWIMSALCLISLIVLWFNTGAVKYDGRTFYVSDTVEPDIKATHFIENSDGTYTAKLFGLIDMGVCRIEHISRPSIEISPYAVLCVSNADYPVIRAFLSEDCNAALAGLHVGDYITAVNGHELSSIDWGWGDYASKPTEDTRFDILRNGTPLTIYCRQSSKDGLFGINYSPQELQIGTLSMIDRYMVPDYPLTVSIGHGVIDNLYSESSQIISLSLSEDSYSIEPVFLPDSVYTNRGLITLNQDNFGLISVFSDELLSSLKLSGVQMETESLDIAWSWEISTEDTAFVLIALDGVTDVSGRRLYTPIPVNVNAFNGKLLDVNGEEINSCNYTISSITNTYETSIDLLKNDNAVFSDTYSANKDTPIRFLNGMSGSPVVQNGRLIGILTSVDVTDPTKAYITDAESIYMNYYNFVTGSGDDING